MKGKFIKKLVAYALTAAMVVSTPMTAFASEFADNFWISHGDPEEDEKNHGEDPFGTGTVSSTNTDTEVLRDSSKVTGIKLKITENEEKKKPEKEDLEPTYPMDLAKGKTIKLEAEVEYMSDAFKDKDGKDLSEAEVKVAKEQMNRKIAWSSSNLNIIRPKVHYNSRQECTVTAYKGGIASMTASVDVDNDGSADFYARVMIIAKKTPTAIKLNIPNNELYANHTYDLMEFVSFGADDQYDVVTFDVKDITPEKKAKLVTWASDGTMKLGKVKNSDKMTAKIKATVKGADGKDIQVSEADGADAEGYIVVNLTEGKPITKLSFVGNNKKPTYEIADEWDKVKVKVKDEDGKEKEDEIWKQTAKGAELTVTLATKDKRTGATMADTTDDITWSTSDSRIVKITPSADNKATVAFRGMSVGKATITATATSGKKASVNVTVTAKLKDIEYARVSGGETWTGKTTPIEIKRIPTQNKSKLKISINKSKDQNGKQKKVVKVKAGINPTITPVNDIVTRLGYSNESPAEISAVEIISSDKKDEFKTAKVVETFKVKQSNVQITGVKGSVDGEWKTFGPKGSNKIDMNSNRVANFVASIDIKEDSIPANVADAADAVSWTTSKETVATVKNGRVNVVGDGSAKITASSVYKDGQKYKVSKVAFTIKSTPKCEEIVLKAGIVTVKGNKPATINVKQQLPKKAADDIEWYTFDSEKGLQPISGGTKKKCVVSKPSDKNVVTVIARTPSGAEAQAKVIWVQ